ncbi:hypothetical protein [Granulicella rosea]|uniref:hypothetical protein n=1 Tax=Granulicella rosea TaxID=474952 RepID=UPI00115C4BE9|nr:hypothetical protein [Granulicella rosea]
MRLEIKGLTAAAGRFTSIWGWYVSGFKSDHHCQACFRGSLASGISKDMLDCDSLALRTDVPYFYLCALGRPRSAESNVHLVVRPQQGAMASVGSLYGATFTIHDAIAIRIRNLPKGWHRLGDEFTQCPNFQFAVQTYGYPLPDGTLDKGES